MPSIRFLNGPNQNQVVPLNGGEICGRDNTTEITVLAPGVSRRHFQFLKENGQFVVADLGSANGTYVNNVRINRATLNHKDMIIVGGIQLEYQVDGPTAPAMAGAETLPDTGGVFIDDEDDDEADFDYSVDASMVFSEGTVATSNLDEANKALRRRLRVTWEISQALASIKDVSELLKRIMDALFEAFPQCDRGLVMVGDTLETLVPAVVQHRSGGGDQKVPVSRTIANHVYVKKQSVLTEDAAEQFGAQMSLVNLQLNSLMCVPLLYQDEALGLLQIDTKDRTRKFTPEDLNLLTGIAGQAAVFLKNASLFQLVEKEAEARTNMQRYFSPELADKLISGELDLKPGGDMKSGTVFFSDIIGFTKMSSTLTPMEVITKINRYFKIMVDIIFRYKGYIDKFGGDAIMAVWGVPVPVPDESLLAVTAAIEMQNALYLFNRELVEEGQPDIQMGIGLNSGSFIAGNLGSEQRMEYTVIGDQVNLAQRVESMAGRGNVFISEPVFERAGRKVLGAKLKPCYVKGVPDPVTMYSVRGVPTRDKSVFIMSLPFFVQGEQGVDGLLVKAKVLGKGKILALVLLPKPPATGPTLKLRFVPQEVAPFELEFQVQRQVPLQAKAGACFNGILDITGSIIETMLEKGHYEPGKSPEDLPRLRTYVAEEGEGGGAGH